MLAPNPTSRPSLDDVVRMLSGSPRGDRESVRSSLVRSGLEEASHEASFAGRELELQRLQKAHQSSERGPTIVLIEEKDPRNGPRATACLAAQGAGEGTGAILVTQRQEHGA